MRAKKDEEIKVLRCHFTGRQFNETCYPMACSCCNKKFLDRESYWKGTEELVTGRYSSGTSGFIFEYRNCTNCQSTLITKVFNERDMSNHGEQQRVKWRSKFKFLISQGISPERAKEMLD